MSIAEKNAMQRAENVKKFSENIKIKQEKPICILYSQAIQRVMLRKVNTLFSEAQRTPS